MYTARTSSQTILNSSFIRLQNLFYIAIVLKMKYGYDLCSCEFFCWLINSPIFSFDEFTSLMQGQLDDRDMDEEIRDTFAVFGTERIDASLLRLMVQVLC